MYNVLSFYNMMYWFYQFTVSCWCCYLANKASWSY